MLRPVRGPNVGALPYQYIGRNLEFPQLESGR